VFRVSDCGQEATNTGGNVYSYDPQIVSGYSCGLHNRVCLYQITSCTEDEPPERLEPSLWRVAWPTYSMAQFTLVCRYKVFWEG
jgi:hypothetical protein